MAEFAWVMKQWRRMCDSMQGGIAKCDGCPLCKVLCQYKPNEKVNFAEAEKIIADWAAEHPEPRYPTFGEWLCDIGELTGCGDAKEAMRRLFSDAIPAELAEKLEIEPKEVEA